MITEAHCLTLSVPVTIRPARREDLPGLEWYGLFSKHRAIFHETFAAQERGEQLMLVADIAGFPAGQVWLDLMKRATQGIGVLWAVRTYPFLQNLGLGGRLVASAEAALRERGFRWAELGVETANGAARRFYERAGYRPVEHLRETFSYRTPDGQHVEELLDEWLMRKDLAEAA